jgi:hypothetical protein
VPQIAGELKEVGRDRAKQVLQPAFNQQQPAKLRTSLGCCLGWWMHFFFEFDDDTNERPPPSTILLASSYIL